MVEPDFDLFLERLSVSACFIEEHAKRLAHRRLLARRATGQPRLDIVTLFRRASGGQAVEESQGKNARWDVRRQPSDALAEPGAERQEPFTMPQRSNERMVVHRLSRLLVLKKIEDPES